MPTNGDVPIFRHLARTTLLVVQEGVSIIARPLEGNVLFREEVSDLFPPLRVVICRVAFQVPTSRNDGLADEKGRGRDFNTLISGGKANGVTTVPIKRGLARPAFTRSLDYGEGR